MRLQKGIQLFFICCCGILGVGLFSVPTAAAYFGQTFYWGHLLLGGTLAVAPILFCSLVSDRALPKAYMTHFPTTGKWLCVAHAAVYAALTACLLAYYTHTLRGWFLDGVPRFLTALFLCAICVFAAAKPMRTLFRTVSFLTVFVLLAVLSMRIVMLFCGDTRNLLPLCEQAYVRTLPQGVAFLAPFFIFSGVLTAVDAPKRTKVWAGLFSVVACTLLLILASAACISILGPIQTAHNLNSSVLAMKNLNLSAMDFFQRGDLVFILTWSMLILCTGALGAHLPLQALHAAFPRAKRSAFALALFLVCLWSALVLPSEEAALQLLQNTAQFGGCIVLILLPTVLCLQKRRNRR